MITQDFSHHFIGMNNIVSKLPFYQYGKYDGSYSEPALADSKVDWTRPMRLMRGEHKILEAKLKTIVSPSPKLTSLLHALKRLINEICGWMQAVLGDHPDKKHVIKNYKTSTEYQNDLTDIRDELNKALHS